MIPSDNPFHALTYGRPIPTGSIGGLSDLRQISLNLIYTIKEIILPINGYVSRYSETIVPGGQIDDPVTGSQVTYYETRYKDLVYHNPDPTNPSLTGLLTTPTINTSGSLAYIDYPRGIIAYSGVVNTSITTTYDYYTVYVQEGYPELGEDPYDLDSLPVPLVSVDFERRRNAPLALGGIYQEDRVFLINVLANSDAQRGDIMDILENSLKFTYPLTIDYRNGFPIHFNGDKNLTFDRSDSNRWLPIRFSDSYSRVLRVPSEEDKLRHQGVIFLTIETN